MSSEYSSNILLSPLVFLLFCCSTIKAAINIAENETIPALFAFGDSILDTGNNNNILVSVSKSNFPPYGRDFVGGKPTGRFSDGKVPSDLIGSKYYTLFRSLIIIYIYIYIYMLFNF
jgi:hypothetical protein